MPVRITKYTLTSLTLHVAILGIASLCKNQSGQMFVTKKLPSAQTVKIRLNHSRTSPPKRRTESKKTPPKDLGYEGPLHHENTQKKNTDYTSLFPKAGEQTSDKNSETKTSAPYGPTLSRQGFRAADEATTKLDIPLVVRKELRQGKAFARIRLINRFWTLQSLDGAPYLRAALHELLVDPKNRHSLKRLFKHMDAGGFRFEIRFRLQISPRAEPGQSQRLVTHRRRILVDILRQQRPTPPKALQTLGSLMSMTLPDREADRAVERDKGHRDSLQRSPAFHAPIRNRRLFGE